ncbi:MAG: NAD-binding protein [Ignisphaera sp.]
MKIFIVGGSKEVIELITSIKRGLGYEKGDFVVLTDSQRDAEILSREFDIPVFTGDLFDEKLYLEVGLDKADVVVAIHDNDMVNIFVSMLAKEMKIPKAIAVVGNNIVGRFLKTYGIVSEVIVKSKELSSNILTKIFDTYFVDVGDRSIMIHIVSPASRIVSRTVKDLEEEGMRVIAIIRSGSPIPLEKDTTIEPGDIVAIFGEKHLISKLFGE